MLKLLFLYAEDPDPGEITSASTSSTESVKSDDSSESVSSSKSSKGLSRRQRKNRRREDTSPVNKTKQIQKVKQSKTLTTLTKKKVLQSSPLGQYLKFEKMNVTEKVFTDLLQHYVIPYQLMGKCGYPTSFDDQYTMVCKNGRKIHCRDRSTNNSFSYGGTLPKVDHLKNEQYDSGQGSSSSSSSSDSEECCSDNSSDHDDDTNSERQIPAGANYFSRTCSRCGSIFYTNAEQYLKTSEQKSKCKYHWGKLQLLTSTEDPKLVSKMYTCCRGKPNTHGCTEAPVHVWDGLQQGVNLIENFVYTKSRRNPPRDGNYGVYAVDCEMCYTVCGLELTKVTVVGMDGRLVYDSYVKPEHEIVDYNTRFSGVSAKDFKRNTPKTLKEVQNDLMGFINAHTILVGHGLENDLRALKIAHFRVVDTSHTFPHPNGLPYRWSLKNLTLAILKRNIQCNKDGHNSYEDARACMELALWQVRKDYKNLLEHPLIVRHY